MEGNDTYVYDGVEVKKTGRTAERKINAMSGAPAVHHTIYEIQPVDPDLDWKKWVDPKLLYKVRKN